MNFVLAYFVALGVAAAAGVAFAVTVCRLTDRKAPSTEPPLSDADRALLERAKAAQAEREAQLRWIRYQSFDVADERPELREEARRIQFSRSHGRLH